MAQGQSQNPQSSNPQDAADPEQERVSGTQLDQQKQKQKQTPRNPDPQDRGQAQQDSRQSGMQERPQADSQDAKDRSGSSS